MAKYRIGRVNDEVQKVVAAALRDVKDPRVQGAFVSVTGASVTPDFKYAKIFYSALHGDKKETATGLKSCTGFIRHAIAEELNLRITPELTFIEDESIANGAHIAELLRRAEASSPKKPDTDKNDN